MAAAQAAPSPQAPASAIEITRAEAVRADWNSVAPPTSGWTPVTLIDFWNARWPRHDGVVWYRVHWQQGEAVPTGLLVDYVCMASAVYLNGSLLARDPHLVEPLSRSWIKPQYFLLDAPLLRRGENTLLVRVSGLSAYQPGFGTVTVGDPGLVRAKFEQGLFARYQILLVNTAMSVVLGTIFLMLWLMRRRDSVYGWFALSTLAGALYAANYFVTSTWPFRSTDVWQAWICAMWVVASASYAMFLLRYAERRAPPVEYLLGATALACVACALVVPHWMGPYRAPWIAAGVCFYWASIAWFLWRAWRVRRADYTVLAVCLLVQVLVSLWDYARFLGVIRTNTPLLALTSVLTLAGIGFALCYRFAAALRRAEDFNIELKREVATATTQLGDTLAREHALALANTRTGERLQLTRDLHDGFGGTLVGAIARLEQAPGEMPKEKIIATLKDMRDDLRLVIDSTAREHADLVDVLAPLRHRTSRMLEAVEIDSHWHLHGIDGVEFGGARSLDLLRLLQEALTNVFKHSRAARVDVDVERIDAQLHVRVRDDGHGLPTHGAAPHAGGIGFANMRLRAQRLGGSLQVESAPGRTELRLTIPLTV